MAVTLPGAVALAVAAALLVAPSSPAAEERFGLLPGSVMQNDDTGVDGMQGYSKGLGYEVVQGYAIAEGDMVLGRVDSSGRVAIPFRPRGLGSRNSFDRWPDGIVPYSFHPALSEIQQDNVEEAIERINEKTRIALVPADSAEAEGYPDYIVFEPSSGCASFVGRQLQEDAQSLWVADSCSIGSIVHEISHAIGVFHEHTRPDRDNHVTVNWDEVIEDKAFNFEIYEDGTEIQGEYDYGSIMHYGEYFFSRTGERTIIAPANTDIGQRVELSSTDIRTIDAMYATDVALDASIFTSDRGLEIEVSVSNLGDLGARGLTLRAAGAPGTDWLSVSAESGWDCLAYEEELRCERDRLIEQANSSFTLVADPATTTEDSIGLQVASITLDNDPDNNASGADVLDDDGATEGGETMAMEPAPAAATPVEEEEDPFATESANSSTGTDQPLTRSNTGSVEDDGGAGGGGTTGLAPLALFGLLVASRRRRGSIEVARR